MPGGNLAANNSQRLAHDVLDLHGDALAHAAAAERENSIDQRPAALAGDHDAFQIAAQPASRGHVAQRHLPVAQDRAEQIVEVVRDAAGERAHRFETLSLAQLVLHPPQFFLGDMAIGHIEHESDHARRLALRIEEHPPLRLQPSDRAGRCARTRYSASTSPDSCAALIAARTFGQSSG